MKKQKLIEGMFYWVGPQKRGWYYCCRFIKYEGDKVIMTKNGHQFKCSWDEIERILLPRESRRSYRYKEDNIERG